MTLAHSQHLITASTTRFRGVFMGICDWLAVFTPFHPKGVLWDEVRTHPCLVPTKFVEWNCSKSFGMLKHSEFLSHHNPPVRQGTFSWRPPNSDSQMENHDSPLQRTRFHCSRVQRWLYALYHRIRRFALHSVMYVLEAAAGPWKPIPWSSVRTVLLKATWSLEVCSDWLKNQITIGPLSHFKWG